MSTKKVSERDARAGAAELASKIKELRARLGMTQLAFASAFGVSRPSVARWESAQDRPNPTTLSRIAKLAPDEDRLWWLERAGLRAEDALHFIDPLTHVDIPLLRDSIAAGSGRVVDESVETQLPLPKQWFPPGAHLVALKVVGNSMAPLVQEGYIVIIDLSERNPRKLVGQMVAAREGDGVTLKWLRKEGKFLQLVPQYTSRDHPVRVIEPGAESEYGIVGRVLKWIGQPPK